MRKIIISFLLLSHGVLLSAQSFNAGTIGNDQTVYYRTAPSAFIFLTSPTGGITPYQYQWQRSDNMGLTFYNIGGATQATYTSPSLPSITLFRCIVTDGSSVSLFTNIITITVWNVGLIGSNQTIVPRTAPQPLGFITQPSGGTLPYSFQWQVSYDNGTTYANIPNATRDVYSPGTLNRKALYRCRVTDAANYTRLSNIVTIDIRSSLVAGTIEGTQSVCFGTVPSGLTGTQATGGTPPYSYQWQYSTSGSGWLSIDGATSTDFSTPTGLTADTWYRRWVRDASGRALASNTAKITVNPSVASAQLHDDVTIGYNTSTNISAVISGGTSPYTINYTRNGIPQTTISNYSSGSSINTGLLITGTYSYSLTSITDANGCVTTQNLGTAITVTVVDDWRYNFTYANRESLFADGWDFIARTASGGSRDTEQTSGAMISYDQQAHPGVLSIPVDEGDFWEENTNNTRNTLFRDIPSTWTSLILRISSFAPTQNYQQAGLVLYQDDDNYIQIARSFAEGGRLTLANEVNGTADDINSITEGATANLHFRLDRDIVSGTVFAYYSLNGSDWTLVGMTEPSFNNPRIAILICGDELPGGYPSADIAWIEVSTQPLPQIPDELHVHPNTIVFNAIEGQPSSATRALFISTTLDRNVTWSQSTNVNWITPDSQNGETEGILRIGINTSELGTGLHEGNIIIESSEVTSDPIIIPVTLIVNPDVPIKATTWKDGRDGAMSVSVDDGYDTASDILEENGFQGTYVYNGTTPPDYYPDLYDAGMELGSHLANHPCEIISDYTLRNDEIEPSIAGLCVFTPQPCEDVITLVWACGITNYREQDVASDYFLSARGYYMNQLEDATPENFMNLKSYNSHEHEPYPPTDLKTVVDMAIAQNKWFNLVLHDYSNDDNAINYAHSKNIWVTSIGNVIKYIMQRDRLILTDYSTSEDVIMFNASRLSIPQSGYRSFETAFGQDDITTLQVDIDDGRTIESVLVDGIVNPYQIIDLDGNMFLLTNVRLQPEPSPARSIEIRYFSASVPQISLSRNALYFNTTIGENPENQSLTITTNMPEVLSWTATVDNDQPVWLSVIPQTGSGNGVIEVAVSCTGLAEGTYYKNITITTEPEASNSPQVVSVRLIIHPEGVFHYDFNYSDRTGLLEDGWNFIAKTPSGGSRNTEQTSGAVVSYDQQVHPGVLRIPVDVGDLWEGANDTRNSLFHDLPSDWTSIRLKISSFDPFQNFQQAGLVLYQDDDNYVQITRNFNSYNGGNIITFVTEIDGSTDNDVSIPASATDNLHFRLDWDVVTSTVISYFSLNGTDWIMVGNAFLAEPLNDPRLAIVVGASAGGFPNADIGWAEISTQELSPIPDDFHAFPNSILFSTVHGQLISDTRSIFVYTTLGRTINLTQSTDVPSWVTPNNQNGVTEDSFDVGVNISGLDPGIYKGNIIISSPESLVGPINVPITLIINPDVPVTATTWKDGKAGVMSVTVDDGYDSASDILATYDFQGTYVCNGTTPPSYYGNLYNAGMELGSHLANHPYGEIADDILRYEEIEPNITGICTHTPQPCEDVLTLVWPNAISSYRMQSVASEYFLSARGDEVNQLEDATPENFMNLKFYAHEYIPDPPDLKTVVDEAIVQKKWFIMCLHAWTGNNDDGAIAYSVGKDIWVTSVGNVIKYILQRDRFCLNNYNTSDNLITFQATRDAIPSSVFRSFETAFSENDITTLQIDIDDSREVVSVLVDGLANTYQIIEINSNQVLLTNIQLEPSVSKTVEIRYSSGAKSDGPDNSLQDTKSVKQEVPYPLSNKLYQNYPNPFRTDTWIEFDLVEDTKVIIEIYDSFNHKIETLLSEALVSGNYSIKWNSRNYPSGIYYLSMRAGVLRSTIKMSLLR